MNVDQIVDKKTVAIPGPIGSVTPEVQALHDETKQWRDEAEAFAGSTQALQDKAVSTLVADASSQSRGALEKLRYGYGCDAVFVGDSLTEGYGASVPAKRWSTILCSWFQWTEHNYAVGGTGWLNGADGTRFPDQCAKAAADTAYDHANVRYCFMFGGVNDGAGDAATATTRAQACIATLRAAFPQATIVAGVGLAGPLKPGATQGGTPLVMRVNYYRAVAHALNGQGVIAVPDAWRWLYTRPDLCIDDALHPNDDGYSAIAGVMAQLVYGTYSTPTLYDAQPAYQLVAAGNTNASLGVNVGYDTITVYGNTTVTIPAGHASIGHMHSTFPLFTMPAWFRPTFAGVALPACKVSFNSQDSGSFYNMTIDSDGVVSIFVDTRWWAYSDADKPATPATGYAFKAGDKITIWPWWTAPIWGIGH